MKRSMLLCVMMLVYVVPSRALTLTRDNLDEIHTRWQAIFDSELIGTSFKTPIQSLEFYKRQLLAIDEEDVALAEQLIIRLCQGDLWDLFMQRKDKNTVLDYLDRLTTALQNYINRQSKITFPPKLDEIEYGIHASSLSKTEYCTRLRRAFLAFTIIVSKMNYIARQ